MVRAHLYSAIALLRYRICPCNNGKTAPVLGFMSWHISCFILVQTTQTIILAMLARRLLQILTAY